MTTSRTSFVELVDRIQTIPSLPEVVAQVCRLVNDPGSDAHQITEIVVKDTAMAAKILRMVNSVYYGLNEPMHALDQAIVILGLRTIRSIALSISVISMFQQQNTCFNMRAFWTHGAVCAGMCRLIAQRTGITDPELAFTIGLLKDIGKLVLVENAPDETKAIIAVAREFHLDFHDAAHEVIDSDDAEIGAWLCARWDLEPDIVETIRCQYQRGPGAGGPNPLVAMCRFAEHLCALKNIRVSGDYGPVELDPQVLKDLGVDKEGLIQVLTAVNGEVENARQLLQQAR